jgi:ABC-type multidrug transport system ATPase subunit
VMARYQGTVLLATHDPREAAMADRVCLLYEGQVARILSGLDYQDAARAASPISAGRASW